MSAQQSAFDKFGMVRAEALLPVMTELEQLNIKDVAGLSLNLLGGGFQVRHLVYQPKADAMKDWRGQAVKIDDVVDEIIELPISQCEPIYFPLQRLHGVKIPYARSVDKQFKKKLPPQFQLNTDGTATLVADVSIKHKPSNSNFWHVELTIKDALSSELLTRDKISVGNLQESDKKKWKPGTVLALSVLEMLLLTSGVKQLEFDRISPSIYNKWLYRLNIIKVNLLGIIKRSVS